MLKLKSMVPATVLTMLLVLPGLAAGGEGKVVNTSAQKTEKAIFAAGCFWKVQYIFSKVPGVVKTRVGYCNGNTENPDYHQVCTDKTGHAEAAQVEYDPSKTSYQKLLETFFANHDPTTMNRQGPDVGTQYRSGIFYLTPEQKQQAESYKKKLEQEHKFKAAIVTIIEPAGKFYDAEEYHQNYFEKHGASCH